MPFEYLISLLINKGYKISNHNKYISINNINILKKNIEGYNFAIDFNKENKQREVIINIEMIDNQKMVF